MSSEVYTKEYYANQRDKLICYIHKSGKTLEEIGLIVSITKERIRQILAENSVSASEGGFRKKCQTVELERIQRRNDQYLKSHGMTWDKWNSIPIDLRRQFVATKRYARTLQSEFKLSFNEWYEIWAKSGKLNERGICGYVLARKDKTGGFTPDNLHIVDARSDRRDTQVQSWTRRRNAKNIR